MKTFVVALVLACVAVVAALNTEHVSSFMEFQHQYGKFYTNPQEYNYRLGVFAANLIRAERLQKTANGTEFGVTKFMDMTPEEFKSTILMSKLSQPELNGQQFKNPSNISAPSSFDWRSRPHVVTPVYNQGQCGSCWAFSATENIESQWALAGHGLQSLSMQQIVSCDTTSYGCNGGWPYSAYEYVQKAGGLELYSTYPYHSGTGTTGSCHFEHKVDAKLSGWSWVSRSARTEPEMVNTLVSTGPVSICVDAQTWQYYKGGVLRPNQCGKSIDHCVELIGYDMGASPQYWIVRNSWGADWGIAGYIHLEYGHDTCALAEQATMSHATK